VQGVFRVCNGEPEELCSLLFHVEDFFNHTLATGACTQRAEEHSDGGDAPEQNTREDQGHSRLSADLGRAIDLLKLGDQVSALAALQVVQERSSSMRVNPQVSLVASVLRGIAAYLDGDDENTQAWLAVAAELGRAYDGTVAATTGVEQVDELTGDDQPSAGGFRLALRRLVATLVFMQSKVLMDLGNWSQASHVAAEVSVDDGGGRMFGHSLPDMAASCTDQGEAKDEVFLTGCAEVG
jgi:hypothetical protein